MKEKYIHILGLAVTVLYGSFVVFLYAAEPRSIADISTKAKNAVGDAVTTGQVLTGAYQVDQAKFNTGLQMFRADNFVAARDAFERADPERRDPKTQFYIAYSFYRQGWGRVSNDDALFKQSLEAVERVAALDRSFRADDANLQLRTPAELKAELEEGLTVSADDFNPLRLGRERK
ncbi:MAG TPA: hypothetical protein VNA22_04245 [Pyrinomonadaceae bacterium]|nr:hypothetical protein [Pyrinomonadaceae bacterium]